MRIGDTDPSTGTGTGVIYTMRTAGFTASNIDPTQYTIGTPNRTNCTVNVRNTGAFAGGPILLMVKNSEILWAWSFWNIAADGTKLKCVPITKASPNERLLNMDIGQASTKYDAFCSNEYRSGSSVGVDGVYRTIFRYQWGRPIPVFYNSVATLNFPGTMNNKGNIPGLVGPVSLRESLRHPCAFIIGSDTNVGVEMIDWLDHTDNNLWGNEKKAGDDNNITGKKTIYDPCPKGYRVADRNSLNSINYNCTSWSRSQDPGKSMYTAQIDVEGNYIVDFLLPGYYTPKTALNSGVFAIASMGGAISGVCTYGIWWSNLVSQQNTDGNYYPSSLTNNSTTKVGFRDNYNGDKKGRGNSVRCEVDTDNR